MSEKIVSPGVFTKEIDETFLPAAVGNIGAAIIGPTVKGPALVPMQINSYNEYVKVFGDYLIGSASADEPAQFFTSYAAKEYLRNGGPLTVVRVLAGTFSPASASIGTSSGADLDRWNEVGGAGDSSFSLETIADGYVMNSVSDAGVAASQALISATTGSINGNVGGSKDNIRIEVSQVNYKKGTFTLLVRQGSDIHARKQILESWNNLTLDPLTSNYIEKVIGNQDKTLQTDSDGNTFVNLTGSFANKSNYIRVKTVHKPTPGYLTEDGDVSGEFVLSGSFLPGRGSGSLGGGFGGGSNGTQVTTASPNYNENITETNWQGFNITNGQDANTSFLNALNVLSNQDAYDINMIMVPGVIGGQIGSNILTKAISVAEDRGDAFVIMDSSNYGDPISVSTAQAEARNTSYAATYYPWVQIGDPDLGKNVWVPPSVVIPGVIAFNDKVAHPWFAPAGLNRGGIDMAITAEKKLTNDNRDTLYDSNVNPIATFPGQGVSVFGQKTLQKKSSALDRINVRRLLITVKKFIASASRFIVFEQNNSATRGRFLNIVNPYLEQVQSNSGLNAFRVVMDESNNTPDSIDRNILYGQLFLQPTRTAEFIVLDFTVQPTGASFPE